MKYYEIFNIIKHKDTFCVNGKKLIFDSCLQCWFFEGKLYNLSKEEIDSNWELVEND